ncbi:prephenate dehydrogenase [Streptomyces albidoflavus]|uniref:prephenate dehydrogenase n=2 Tax=Streptomyces TaxID=1883 RepID=UPI00096B1F27|nr:MULTISPECIES: prephenate dehydrogenase [Streptomyces]
MRSALVVGTGLVGTSTALALVRRGISVYLRDTSAESARVAAGLGAGRLEAPQQRVDIAIAAVPPSQVATVVRELQQSGTARAYTDVASVKSQILHEVASIADAGEFVGGHPLAGGERSGPVNARADIFEGRPWVLTPSTATSQTVLNAGLELASLVGAVPVLLEARRHDSAVALVSHTPHLVASVMAARLDGAATEATRLAGQGIRDVTRVAASDVDLWSEILAGNAVAVADLLEDITRDLQESTAALRNLSAADQVKQADGHRRIRAILRSGRSGREKIPVKHGAGADAFSSIIISVADEPGELARIFAAVENIGVNVEDVKMEHSPSGPAGEAALIVSRENAAETARHLSSHGWHAKL